MEKAVGFVEKKYMEFFKKKGYIPRYFNAKNCTEIVDYAPALTTSSGSATGIGSILILEEVKDESSSKKKRNFR